jgi:putative FmdB family regulatory protein
MPIYEYKCLKCSQQFEILQKISDEPLKKCEDCGVK